MEFSRKMYLQKLVRADGNGMIKIVTGVRQFYFNRVCCEDSFTCYFA